MAKNLLIVESPAKAKTIEKILGSDFQVKSCFGHIRDLQKAGMGIDMDKNYEPTYIISPEKEKVVKDLKGLAKKSDEVWLATDEDREGPNCYCQSARINRRRRDNPANKAPIRNRVHAMARRMRGENAPGKAREQQA
jgi:DNA topoisomerase IA